MTTVIDFAPSTQAPFQFQATLDGQTYNCIATWNLFGQRWYLNVYDLSSNLIVARAMVGSPVGVNLESATWANGYVTVVTSLPHGYLVSDTVNLTVSGCAPDALNGAVQAFVIDPMTLTYPLAADPGPITALGVVAYNVNLVGGYFTTSVLVFRAANNQFEITP